MTCSSDIAVQRVGYCEGPPAVFGFMYVCIVFCCCYFCILSGPGSSAKLARAVKDRQSPTVGQSKNFQKKKLLRHSNGSNLETKTDIVMSTMGKMVVTHRATNVLLTK